MKTSYKMAWVGLVMLALSIPAMAKASKKGPAANLEKAVAQLDLSKDQQTKINGIISDLQQKLGDLRQQAKASGDKSAVRTQVKEAMTGAVKQIADVLSPAQRAKFHKLMQETRAKRMAKHSGSTTQPAAE